MGVVIVGPSGAGKSTLWRMLRAALIKTDRVVSMAQCSPSTASSIMETVLCKNYVQLHLSPKHYRYKLLWKEKSILTALCENALPVFFPQVRQYIMNPKAMPRQQLLGQIDMDTREWMDGVLTNSARNVVREPQGHTS